MKIVICLSGGMDSAVLLARLKDIATELHCLSFDYGQKHRHRELDAARRLCMHYGIENHTVLDLSALNDVFGGSALTGNGDIPEGHYEDESMKATVVPNRNMIMLSLATGYAIKNDLENVGYAAHAGDHAIYPDCRQGFTIAMRKVMTLASYKTIHLYAPFVLKSKAEIVQLGKDLDVPFYLTWSCYKGGQLHCGKCGTCVERLEAFEEANAKDGVVYES